MSEKPGTQTVEPSRKPRRSRSIDYLPSGIMLRLRFEPRSAMSDEVFQALAAGNPELRLELTAQRDLEIMSPCGSETSEINLDLSSQLWNWTKKKGRGLGHGYDSSGGFILPNGATRSPDASWVTKDRWESRAPVPREVFFRLCPDFVVEIRSQSDRPYRIRKKMLEYIDQGARLGWFIDPLNGKVEIYRPGLPVEKLLKPPTLSGEDVLPGFVLDLSEILGKRDTRIE